MARRLSRPSRIMLWVTAALALFALWSVFVSPPQVNEASQQPPKVWSSELALPEAVVGRVEGLALTLQSTPEGVTAAPQALEAARQALSRGKALLLVLETGEAPSADPGAAAEVVLAWTRAQALSPAVLLSQDWPLLEALAPLAPDLRLGFATSEARLDRKGASPWLGGRRLSEVEGSIPALVKAAGGSLWAPPLRNLRPEDVADARALSIEVLVTGVDDPETFPSLLLLRPEALLTDRPEALSQAIAERPGLFAVGSALE